MGEEQERKDSLDKGSDDGKEKVHYSSWYRVLMLRKLQQLSPGLMAAPLGTGKTYPTIRLVLISITVGFSFLFLVSRWGSTIIIPIPKDQFIDQYAKPLSSSLGLKDASTSILPELKLKEPMNVLLHCGSKSVKDTEGQFKRFEATMARVRLN